jgi:hypothetical protein
VLGGLLDPQPGSHRRAQIGLQVASLDLQAKLQHPGVQVGSEEMTIGRAPEHGVYRADPSQGLAAELDEPAEPLVGVGERADLVPAVLLVAPDGILRVGPGQRQDAFQQALLPAEPASAIGASLTAAGSARGC